MQTLVAALGIHQPGMDLSRLGRDHPQSIAHRHVTAACPVTAVHKHTVVSGAGIGSGSGAALGALGEEEVAEGGLEQVVLDLVVVGDGLDVVGADVALVVEALDAAPDADVRVEGAGVLGAVLVVLLVGVEPLLHLDDARAVVDPKRHVGRLRGDGAHHADKGHLGYLEAVDAEGGVWIGLLGVDQLLDGDGAEGGVAVALRVGSGSVRGCRVGRMARFLGVAAYLSCTTLASVLGAAVHETSGIVATACVV